MIYFKPVTVSTVNFTVNIVYLLNFLENNAFKNSKYKGKSMLVAVWGHEIFREEITSKEYKGYIVSSGNILSAYLGLNFLKTHYATVAILS